MSSIGFYRATFHVARASREQLEAAVDRVMTALLDLEDEGAGIDSAAVSVDFDNNDVEFELRAHGATLEEAEQTASRAIQLAIAASEGEVPSGAPLRPELGYAQQEHSVALVG